VHAFTGSEPLVGELIGLRTFRVDESGLLLPLYSDRSWYDGPNCATCAPPTGEPERCDHQVAAPDCDCGFYAFGSVQAASRYRSSRYVQAVVACWGSVVGGTQGIRAEHARIEAIWLGPGAPAWLVKRVCATYPSARVYLDRDQMLAEHPLSVLSCYAAPHTRSWPRQVGIPVAGGVLIGLGLVPPTALRGDVWDAWLSATVVLSGIVAWLLVSSRRIGHSAAAVVMASVLAWFAAPLFGLAGWLLRLPAIRAGLVAGGSWLMTLWPGYFPIVRSPVPRELRGLAA
jgi:hypothetical protein